MQVRSSWFLLLVAIAQFCAPLLPAMGIGQSIGDRATAAGLPPELPTGIFFSIWGIIFLGFLGIAVLSLLRRSYPIQKIAMPLALAGLGNVIWMISAQSLDLSWLNFVLLIPILLCIWEAAHRLDRIGGFDGTPISLLLCLTIGLFAGWISIAVSISVPDLVRGILGRGASDFVWQSLWLALVPALVLAWLFASRVSRNFWYFVALAWGLTGIIVNNWFRLETHALALAVTALGAYALFRRVRFGAKGSQAAKL